MRVVYYSLLKLIKHDEALKDLAGQLKGTQRNEYLIDVKYRMIICGQGMQRK